MSLPKRDGVHGRCYLIRKPDTDPEVLAHADQCIQDVLDGTAKENHSGSPVVVRNQSGTPFLPSQLLERYLSKLPLKGFPSEDAFAFCDSLRRLVGWKEIDYTLRQYIEKQVQDRYFEVGEREDGFTVFPPCTVWPELRPEDVDEGLLRFACYVAVCYTVYGLSFEYLTTEHILGLVSQLRPDMVKELKTNGSGKLPPNIQKRKTKHRTASANDAFATIRITARDCTEGCCGEALSYLVEVLEQPEFPRSYSIEFRGPEKLYLPIPGLPKKGVNQLFACAVRYPRLHVRMENYARLAMREDEVYQMQDSSVHKISRSGTGMEYIKFFWESAPAGEPLVILYEVDTENERLALRSIDIFEDGSTRNIPDLYDGAIEITPIPTVEELNAHVWGEEFHACVIEKAEFEAIWETHAYDGALK